MGKENGGIDEVWVHPFRILRDYQAGIVTGDSVAWLKNVIFQVEIRPESITRIYKTPFGKLREIIFPSFERGGAIVHYRADFFHDVRLVIKFSSDLRWMWPYDEYSLGDVYFGYDSKLKALHVKDQTGDFYCIFGGDVKPDQHFEGAFSKILWKDGHLIGEKTSVNQVYHAVVFSLNRRNNHCLNYVLVGTDHGKNEALSDYQSLLKNPRKEFECIVSHYRHLLDLSVTIETPDKEFNHLWKWALIGTDQFFVYTPSLGKGLVAGFATTARGWNGGHKNSGRPGYAWYFGRDSEWSCFAIDSYGDFELVKKFEIINPYKVSITYKEPFSPGLISWGIGIIPQHIFVNGDFNTHPANRKPVGTGPYKFVMWKTDEKIVLVSNPDYFEGPPNIAKYIYRIIPDQSVQFLELTFPYKKITLKP